MKILATIDGSKESTAVIPELRKIAKEANAEVVLLTVCKPPKGLYPSPARFVRPAVSMHFALTPAVREPGNAGGEPYEAIDQATERVINEAHDFLREHAAPLEAEGLKVTAEAVIAEDVAQAIVDFADEEDVDLIAMATHGRGGLREVVQGSVASAVLRTASRPVMLVRPQGR